MYQGTSLSGMLPWTILIRQLILSCLLLLSLSVELTAAFGLRLESEKLGDEIREQHMLVGNPVITKEAASHGNFIFNPE